MLVMDPRFVLPLPPPLQGMPCACCNGAGANWRIATEDGLPTCSLCLLYRTRWGQRNEAAREELITLMREQEGLPMVSRDGKLVSPADGDRLVLSALLMGRVQEARQGAA